jgi:hypothetical protein
MDVYADRRHALPAAAAGRNYSFEISAALSVALMGATAWAVLAANWAPGAGGAVVVAITSVIEAALLAQARAPRIATAIAAPFLGLAAIVPTTLAAMPAVPGQTVGAIAGHYLRALFTGLASNQAWDFTVGLCAILFLCGYWLGWVVLREHRGVLAVIPIFSVLATNVVNAANPAPIALPEVIAVVLAIGVVAAAYMGSLGDRWAASRITALDGLGWRFGTSVAVVAAALTILALVIPPVSTTDISAKLFPHGLSFGSSGKGGGGPRTVLGQSTIGFNDSVTLGGPLVSNPQLVMTYTVDTNAAVYLRVADDTIFDKGSWTPEDSTNDNDPTSTWTSFQFPLGKLPRDIDPADGGIGQDDQTVTANLTLQANATGDQSLVPFTGDPESVDLAGTAQGVAADPQAGALLTVDEVKLYTGIVNGTRIQTSAYISTATQAQLEAAGTAYPSWTKQFTDLTDDATHGVEAIRSLAQQWTAGITNPYDQAIAIEEHLRNPAFFTYTLNPPQDPNAGMWPVVYFLTTSHKGYCQYFASAMGSMLRSLGIPTRLVSGYGPGTTRAQSGRQGGREQEVSTSDAHSWVEAYFPGYGWIPFEPTPPSSQGDYQPFPRGTQAVTGGTSTPAPSPKTAPTPKVTIPLPITSSVVPTSKSGVALSGPVLIALAVLGAILVLFVVLVLWFLLPRSLTGAWRRVETLGAISGVDRRRAETHRAFAARLARARPQAAPALTELASVTARAEFSASGASGTERAQALRTWRRVLFAATLRPKRSPG